MAEIEYDRSGRIGVITLNRPAKRNCLTYGALNTLAETVADAGRDPAVAALVLTGAGGSFCAGTDLSELAERPADQPGNVDWSEPRGAWFLIDCPKPVVAAVDGPAVGMGAELSCQADLRVASGRARFSWIFPQRGLVPDMGVSSLLLPHIVGLPASLDLLYSGLADAQGHLDRHRLAFGECLASDDHREGVRAFLERRPPDLRGR